MSRVSTLRLTCGYTAERQQADCIASLLITVTEYGGHAKEIVQKLDVDKYDAIVVFSGDGLFHEAINGLCKRPDAMTVLKKCPLGTLPGGQSIIPER